MHAENTGNVNAQVVLVVEKATFAAKKANISEFPVNANATPSVSEALIIFITQAKSVHL